VWVFGVKLSDVDIAEIECLRVVAMSTNFGTKLLLTGFVWTIATRQLVMYGGLSYLLTECRIADTLHIWDIAMATSFWLSMGYNFGCMIASNTLFDSTGGFSASSYPISRF